SRPSANSLHPGIRPTIVSLPPARSHLARRPQWLVHGHAAPRAETVDRSRPSQVRKKSRPRLRPLHGRVDARPRAQKANCVTPVFTRAPSHSFSLRLGSRILASLGERGGFAPPRAPSRPREGVCHRGVITPYCCDASLCRHGHPMTKRTSLRALSA